MTEAIPFFTNQCKKLFALEFNVNQFAIHNDGVTLVFVGGLLSAGAVFKIAGIATIVGSNLFAVFVTGADAFFSARCKNHNTSESDSANSKYFLHNNLIFNDL